MPDQFTRREVDRTLLVAAFAALVPFDAALRAPRATLPLFDFAIAGGFYHGLAAVVDDLVVGESLVLRSEPGNPHDANAVEVLRHDGRKLGYVPRAANEPVARLLGRQARVQAVVVGRLDVRRAADVPDDLVFTGFTHGDPRIRLALVG